MANSLNIDLKDKFVVLSKEAYPGSIIKRVFHCEGGFGISSDTMGTAIFGYFIYDGERCRVEGYEVDKLATNDEIEKARKLRK